MNSKKNDVAGNFDASVDFIERAAHDHADIIVFQDISLTGYFTSPKYLSSAISVEDIGVKKIIALSKIYGLTIIFGLSEKDGDRT